MKQIALNKMFSTVNSVARNRQFFIPFKKRIGYIGWLGRNNLGDEAMFRAIRELFFSLNILPFKDTEKLKLLQEFRGNYIYDAIFLGGGTLISRNYLDIFRKAKNNNKLKIVFGSGVQNPIFWDTVGVDNRLTEWVDILGTCDFVGVRGPLSANILSRYGFNNAEVIGDPGLNFAREKIKRKARNKILGINIGISNGFVWGNESEILNSVIRLSRILINDGWKLKFLPVWDRDIPYIEEAVKNIGGKTEIFKSWESIDQTLDFLEQCDLFIGEKLHSVILAMCAYTPSVMLEYRPKCLDFMMSMDLEKYNIRTDELSLDKLIDLMTELLDNTEHFQNKIAQKVTYYKQLQKKTSQHITELIINT